MEKKYKKEFTFLDYIHNIKYKGEISNEKYEKLYDDYFDKYYTILMEIDTYLEFNHGKIEDIYVSILNDIETFTHFKNRIIEYLQYYIIQLNECKCNEEIFIKFRDKLEYFYQDLNQLSQNPNRLGCIFEWANVLENIHFLGYYIFKIKGFDMYSKGCDILKLRVPNLLACIIRNITIITFNSSKKGFLKDVEQLIKQKYTYPIKRCNKKDIEEYLLIANEAYKDVLFLENNSADFYNYKGIICFTKVSNNNLFVGFRGTYWKNLNQILVDLSQLAGISPGYIIAVGIIALLREKYPNKKIIICGHSLGGGLGQFAAIPFANNVEAYCFNSAGLFPDTLKILKRISYQNTNIKHVRLNNDWVSMFGKLYGDIYTIPFNENCYKSHLIKSIASCFGIKLS